MRPLRALALAVVTIAVAIALVGPASASAIQKTVLCVAEEVPCQAENVSEGGVKFAGESMDFEGAFTYLGVSLKLTCEKSELDETYVVEEVGSPRQEGYVSYLKFTGCSVGKTKCTVGSLNIPWRLLLGYKAGGGSLTVAKQPETGFPGSYVECGGFFSCNYYFSELDEELPEQYVAHFDLVHSGSTHRIFVNGVRLISTTGMCLVNEVTFSATYFLSQPESLWVSYIE